jgi:hypothetical protein
MAYSEVQIIALIFAIGIIAKLVFVYFKKKQYISFVQKIYKNQWLLVIIELALAALVFYYLQMQLTFVQIVACLVLGALLTGITFGVYAKELLPKMVGVLRKRNAIKRSWLPIIIWLALAIWTLKELFF